MSYKKSPFEQTPRKNVNLTRFDRSYEYKTAFQPGYLIPVMLQETLPMDNWRINSEFMFRFNPMYFPIMHKMTMRADYYYVPNRILWPGDPTGNLADPGWKRWITEQFETLPPQMDAKMGFDTDTWNNNVLGFMGIPLLRFETEDAGLRSDIIEDLNAFPLSGYLAIWDEYYRVPQIEVARWFPLTEDKTDNTTKFTEAYSEGITGPNGYYPCLSAKWQKDYFTSALPTPQHGDALQIPMTSDPEDPTTYPTIWMETDGSPAAAGNLAVGAGGPSGHTEAGGFPVFLDNQTNAADIKQLRIAEVLQSFRERIMKIGTRYRDYFKGLWGGDPEPGVVDVPILFGSTFGRVQIADVMSQAFTGDIANHGPGDYGGQANLYANENEIHQYHCREHGFIMCILQVNPNTSYGQGIHRLWRRDVQTDYALDIFSGIGDQEILKEEVLYNNLIVDNTAGLNQQTFGYIERFAEYKYQNDIFTMQLAWTSGVSQHLGRLWYDPFEVGEPETPPIGLDYSGAIEINQEFINTMSMDPGLSMGDIRITDVWRVLAQNPFATWPNQALIFAHIFHSITVDRALPLYSTPKLGI